MVDHLDARGVRGRVNDLTPTRVQRRGECEKEPDRPRAGQHHLELGQLRAGREPRHLGKHRPLVVRDLFQQEVYPAVGPRGLELADGHHDAAVDDGRTVAGGLARRNRGVAHSGGLERDTAGLHAAMGLVPQREMQPRRPRAGQNDFLRTRLDHFFRESLLVLGQLAQIKVDLAGGVSGLERTDIESNLAHSNSSWSQPADARRSSYFSPTKAPVMRVEQTRAGKSVL